MRIAVVTMAQNEATFLPVWFAYYASQVGRENLFVIDHGSDDGSTDVQGISVMRLPRTPLDEMLRAKTVSSIHSSLLGYYDVVIYTDADEFIIADPDLYSGLREFLERNQNPIISSVGLNVVHVLDREVDIDFSRPPLTQRSVVRFSPYFCKPTVSRVPVDWLPGFHEIRRGVAMHSDLYLFHLKSIDLKTSIKQQANRRASRLTDTNIAEGLSLHFNHSDEEIIKRNFSATSTSIAEQMASGFSFRSSMQRMLEDPMCFAKSDWPYANIPSRFRYAIPAVNR